MSPDLESMLGGSAWVRNLARSLVADPHVADDLVQEAWVVALESAPEGADRPGLRRWLAAVLRNLARDRRRGAARRGAREGDVARARGERDEDDGAVMLERLDTHRRIVEAVRALDEPYRTAVLLRYFEGAGPGEIARRLRVPLRTVHSRLNRALSKLRSKLRGDFGGGRGTWLLALLPLSRKGGWTTGALSGALIMDAKLKFAFAGAALFGVAAVATLSRDDLASPEPAVAAATPRVEAVLETPVLDAPEALPQARSPGAPDEPSLAAPRTEPAPAAAAAHEFRGRVFDVEGAALAGVRVGLRGALREAQTEQQTETARDGRFVIESHSVEGGGDPSQGEIVLLDERYTPVMLPTMSFRSASDVELVLIVAPRQPLGGIVVDQAGTPLSGARVTIDVVRDFPSLFNMVLDDCRIVRETATANEDGRFALPRAPRMQHAVLVTAAPGFVQDVRGLPSEPTADLEIVLGVPAAQVTVLEGSVVDLVGQPVEGAFVALEFANGTTDAAGRFTLRLDGAGERGVLMALKRGMLPGRIERSGSSNLAPGAWPEPLVLTLGGAPHAIRGRVVDADGEPIAGAKVWTADTTHFGAVESGDFGPMVTLAADVESLLGDAGDDRKWETGSDGSFAIDGLLDKDYRISVHDVRNVTFHRTAPVRAGTEGLTITMSREERLARVAGRVVGHDGAPVAGVSIALCRLLEPRMGYAEDIASPFTHTDAEGRFELRDLPVSLDHASLHGDGLDFTNNRLPIPAGADLEQLEFVATRHCRLRIELGDPERADGFRLLDADDRESRLSFFRGNVAWSASEGDLVDGRSEAVSASELATTLVLTRAHEEVERVSIQLRYDELNVLRL